MKVEYIPQPISTDDITLSPEIMDLSERIAKNVHEVWAKSRMAEGWTYGPVRDDIKKQHPCLVPYDELPEITALDVDGGEGKIEVNCREKESCCDVYGYFRRH